MKSQGNNSNTLSGQSSLEESTRASLLRQFVSQQDHAAVYSSSNSKLGASPSAISQRSAVTTKVTGFDDKSPMRRT